MHKLRARATCTWLNLAYLQILAQILAYLIGGCAVLIWEVSHSSCLLVWPICILPGIAVSQVCYTCSLLAPISVYGKLREHDTDGPELQLHLLSFNCINFYQNAEGDHSAFTDTKPPKRSSVVQCAHVCYPSPRCWHVGPLAYVIMLCTNADVFWSAEMKVHALAL